MDVNDFFKRYKAFLVTTDLNPSFCGVAMHVSYSPDQGLHFWDVPQGRDVVILTTGARVEDGVGLARQGWDGALFSFTPLTLNVYRSRVKGTLVGEPEFETEEAMLQAFEESIY